MNRFGIAKKRLSILLVAILIFVIGFNNGSQTLTLSASSSKITIKIGNKALVMPFSPVIQSGIILAPAETLVKAMGAKYKYVSKSKTITVTKGKTIMVLKINSKSAKINGKNFNLPIAPKLIKVPFVPVKYICEKLGYSKYSYNSSTKIAAINKVTPKPTVTPEPTEIPQINVYLIGDSIVADAGVKAYPAMGWGQTLSRFFNDGVLVHNNGVSGSSTKSYVADGYWADVKSQLKKGDYLFIQFGANDHKLGVRYTDPETTYKDYLKQFIDFARSKKVTPVLLTPICSLLDFDKNGIIQEPLAAYSSTMRKLGIELNVPVIDLAAKSKALLESLGTEKSKELYITDGIHLQEQGAQVISGFISEGVKELVGPPLSENVLSIT